MSSSEGFVTSEDGARLYFRRIGWARLLPNARLVTVDDGAHLPWIEARELVFGSIRRFLGGDWPPHAHCVAPDHAP